MTTKSNPLKTAYQNGVRKVTQFYTREVNGKRVPNYKTIGLTAAVVAAAGTGYYLYRRHKKHGLVIQKAPSAPAHPPMQ